METMVELESPVAAEKVAEITARREVTPEAAATPLPGPLADAFAIAPEIKVGRYKVRAFLEGDFELLQALKHPLYEMLVAMFSGKKSEADYFPRGEPVWLLCLMFTRSFDENEELVRDGLDKFRAVARAEFGRLPTAVILKLHKAIFKQVMIASATAIAYGAAEDDDGSKKNAAAEPS